MLRYETLFLTVPEITADESAELESQFDKLVSDAKGNVISFERWGKYQLAYPIRKYDYGVYFLARFEVDEEHKTALLEAIRILFAVRYVDLAMRHVIMRLDSQGSLEYKRPESLEEVPTRDVDTFLKENKMTGLLSKSSGSRQSEEMEQEFEQE